MSRLRRKSAATAPLFLYAIQQGDGGPIQLGASENRTKRLAALQRSSGIPLRLLLATRHVAEPAAQRRFRHLRIDGEWFRPEADLLAWITATAAEPSKGTTEPDSRLCACGCGDWF